MMLRQFFGPVMWHHQRRPLRPRLGLQNKKGPPGIGRGGLLRRSSQSSVYIEKRERERERERRSPRDNRSCSNNFFCTPFNIFACYMSILPPSSTRPNEDALKASCDQGSCSGTNHFRGPKSHLEGKSGPPWIGEEYSLTHDNLLHTI
jgi:hypothetical protein